MILTSLETEQNTVIRNIKLTSTEQYMNRRLPVLLEFYHGLASALENKKTNDFS